MQSRARNATRIAINNYDEDVEPADLCDEVVSMLTPTMPDDMTVEELSDIVAEAVDEVL